MAKPIAYSYGDICVPQLPTYDETAYPYLYLYLYSTAYAVPSAITVTKPNSWSSVKATLETPFLCSKLKADENGKEYWTEWEVVTESTTITTSSINCWTNHDIVNTSANTVYLAAGDEPTPVYLPEVLFDGDVTTEDASYSDSADATICSTNAFMVGDTLRVTINGVSEECTLERVATSNQIQVGNAGLNGNDIDAPDDGGEWLLAWVISGSPANRRVYFYTRTAGTYSLKVERIAIEGYEDEPEPEPEPTIPEGDFYRVINGAWAKRDAVRPMGGEWVKQDEYRYE